LWLPKEKRRGVHCFFLSEISRGRFWSIQVGHAEAGKASGHTSDGQALPIALQKRLSGSGNKGLLGGGQIAEEVDVADGYLFPPLRSMAIGE
jgi:hypothetical protein